MFNELSKERIIFDDKFYYDTNICLINIMN